jgi:DNA-binding NtrC family response regulator
MENESGTATERETILYLADQSTSSTSISAALRAIGYEVVSTNSPTQATALLFVMHSVAGVVLNQQAKEQASFDVAQSMRAIRPDVPIALLCGDRIEPLPSPVEACVSIRQPLENLIVAVRRLFAVNRPGTSLADPAHSAV